jgi:hypothetical protein
MRDTETENSADIVIGNLRLVLIDRGFLKIWLIVGTGLQESTVDQWEFPPQVNAF